MSYVGGLTLKVYLSREVCSGGRERGHLDHDVNISLVLNGFF